MYANIDKNLYFLQLWGVSAMYDWTTTNGPECTIRYIEYVNRSFEWMYGRISFK